MAPIPTIKLNDGHEIPVLAYGLGTANSKRRNSSEDIVEHTITGIKAGFYHLDGAESYDNEEELGSAIRAAGVPREKLFVTTKASMRSNDPIEKSFSRSLEKLGLDYVDLYLIHQPYYAKMPEDHQKRWAELEAIKASGRARSIGVSNYLQEHLEPLLVTAKVVPAINQIEFHPYHQSPELFPFLKKHGIAVSAYGPLVPLTKAPGGPVDPILETLSKKYGVSTGEVLLRWVIDQGIVAITTSSKEERLKGIVGHVPAFNLAPEEIEQITVEGRKKEYKAFG
ncbi:Aldo/keto reductase [Thozetella sp. PMI_491]|nr:Aldo/keto reductase [Thozetella sp. PMI_491]